MKFFQSFTNTINQPESPYLIDKSFDIRSSYHQTDIQTFLDFILENIEGGKILQIPCTYMTERHPGATIKFIWFDTENRVQYLIDTECSSLKKEIWHKFYLPLKKEIEQLPGVSFCDYSVYDYATFKNDEAQIFVCGMIVCPDGMSSCQEYKTLQQLLWDKSLRHLSYNLGLPKYTSMKFGHILSENLLPEMMMFKPDLCQVIIDYIDGLDVRYFSMYQENSDIILEFTKKGEKQIIKFNVNDY